MKSLNLSAQPINQSELRFRLDTIAICFPTFAHLLPPALNKLERLSSSNHFVVFILGPIFTKNNVGHCDKTFSISRKNKSPISPPCVLLLKYFA